MRATDKYFEYSLNAYYDDYMNSFIEAASKSLPISQRDLRRLKDNMWSEVMAGVGTNYNFEHISGETVVGNFSVRSSLKLSAQAFEHDFSRVFINANHSKIKIIFCGSYISKILLESALEIILEKD